MNERSDSELLCDYVQRRCESSFSELVNRHIALVYSVALRVVVDPHLAEDVTQTTFTILAREARHLAGHALLSSWLHRTAWNQAAKFVRGEMRRRAREQEAYAMQSVPAESDADWKRIAPMLDAALNKLADTDRAVILLRYFEKKSAKDIGGVLQVSEEAAQKRVARALERLRGLLAGHGAVLSTASLATLMVSESVVAAPLGLSTSISATILAGGTITGGITASTFKLILMSKLKLGAVSALLAVAIATPLVLQHQTVTRLRLENSALQAQAQEADALRSDNNRLSAQLLAAQQVSGSNGDSSELLRLRSEVGRLHALEAEVAKLREESERDQAQARKATEDLVATQQGTLQFAVQRITSIDAMKQVGLQLRQLAAANNLGAAFTADGKLDPKIIAVSHPNFDVGNVELAVSDRSQLQKLLQEGPDIIVARTAEAIHTPDDRWMRFYIQADGSVQNYSTPGSNQVFSANWQLERSNP